MRRRAVSRTMEWDYVQNGGFERASERGQAGVCVCVRGRLAVIGPDDEYYATEWGTPGERSRILHANLFPWFFTGEKQTSAEPVIALLSGPTERKKEEPRTCHPVHFPAVTGLRVPRKIIFFVADARRTLFLLAFPRCNPVEVTTELPTDTHTLSLSLLLSRKCK